MTVRDPQNPLRQNLLGLYETLSSKIAGGQRTDHRDLLPGADDPLEGLVPDDYRSDLVDLGEWFQPSDWAGLSGDDPMRIDLASIPAPGKTVTAGKGLDFFRSGEAPSNYANRNNPLYQARREFAVSVAPKIEEMFGVSAGGSAGYMRAPKASHADPGGPSSNSDHYSGGAIDFYGTKEEMIALRNWAETQPWVSFVRCQSESHYDHAHLSVDIGWIAKNYFSGRQTPTLPSPVARAPQASTRPPTTPGEPPTDAGVGIAAPPPMTTGRPS
jgi:hypothetical protein